MKNVKYIIWGVLGLAMTAVSCAKPTEEKPVYE